VIRNGTTESIKTIIDNLNSAKLDPSTEVVIAPPFLYLHFARELADPKIAISAQNVFDRPNGAFTGEVCVDQLKDVKATWTLVGHSERRTLLKETDDVCSFPADKPISPQLFCGL
jgi:Triosephosphate isomerase